MALNILVLGGTGFVGHTLCELLVEEGHRVTLPTRTPAQHKALGLLPGVTLLKADVHHTPLAPLIRGHDAVVNLIGVLHGSAAVFERNHVTLPQRVARDMHTAGVRRLVHVSALGVSDDAAPENAPSRYLRSKAKGEAVLRDLTEGLAGLQLTVLRPSVMFGAHDHLTNLFATLQRRFPVIPLGGANTELQPVWVRDVARAILRCLVDPYTTVGHIYECVGPQALTLENLVRFVGFCTLRFSRPIIPLPDVLARLQAVLLSCLPGEPLMTCDNLDTMRVPNRATQRHPGLPTLGIKPASLEAILPTYLGHGTVTQLDLWRHAARR
jgi:NADH dehydrogenase